MLQIASRHYAFEGRTFVLAVGSIMPVRDLPTELSPALDLAGDPDALVMCGGSAIIAPNGEYIAGPIFDEETILIAELDLMQIRKEQMALDVTGHYTRDDVFGFCVHR